MASLSPLEDLQRFVTVEVAAIYNAFCKALILAPDATDTGEREKKKFADLVRMIPNRDHSAVSRILDSLNKKCLNAFGSELFVKGEGAGPSDYILLPLGESFLRYTNTIADGFSELVQSNTHDGRQVLRIAINTFSFHTLLNIERKMRALSKLPPYERKIVNLRSHQIFDAVKHDKTVDAGIVESILPVTEGRQLEVIHLSKNRLKLASRITIPNKYFNSKNEIRFDYIKEIPLLLGDTSNFFDVLIALDVNDKNSRKNMMKKLPYSEKRRYVTKNYNIKELSNSVSMLVDVFLLGNDEFSMIVTPEVEEQIKSNNNKYYLRPHGGQIWEDLQFYKFEDRGLFLSKYAIRNVQPFRDDVGKIAKAFWHSCYRVNKEMEAARSR